MKNWQPRCATAVSTFAGGSGEPPQETIRSEVRSTCRSAGLFTSIVIIVDAMLVHVIPSCSMVRSASPASKAGRITCVPPTMVMEYMAKASTRWNIGAK